MNSRFEDGLPSDKFSRRTIRFSDDDAVVFTYWTTVKHERSLTEEQFSRLGPWFKDDYRKYCNKNGGVRKRSAAPAKSARREAKPAKPSTPQTARFAALVVTRLVELGNRFPDGLPRNEGRTPLYFFDKGGKGAAISGYLSILKNRRCLSDEQLSKAPEWFQKEYSASCEKNGRRVGKGERPTGDEGERPAKCPRLYESPCSHLPSPSHLEPSTAPSSYQIERPGTIPPSFLSHPACHLDSAPESEGSRGVASSRQNERPAPAQPPSTDQVRPPPARGPLPSHRPSPSSEASEAEGSLGAASSRQNERPDPARLSSSDQVRGCFARKSLPSSYHSYQDERPASAPLSATDQARQIPARKPRSVVRPAPCYHIRYLSEAELSLMPKALQSQYQAAKAARLPDVPKSEARLDPPEAGRDEKALDAAQAMASLSSPAGGGEGGALQHASI